MAEVKFEGTTPANPTLEQEAAALDAAAATAQQQQQAPSKQQPQQGKQPADTGDRPVWLPEQFKTVEDYTKSYNDGRAELTRVQQELASLKKGQSSDRAAESPAQDANKAPQTDSTKAAADAATAATEAAKQAQETVAKAGIDVAPFQAEFNSTGDIGEAGRAKLAESLKGQFGDSARQVVDSFIEGQKAAANNMRNAAFAEAGGQEQYGQMVNWAKSSLKPAEIAAYNKAVDSGDANTALLAIRGLRATFERANPTAPKLVSGENRIGNVGNLDAFESTKQMTDAINDPRYAKDPAYRARVETRIRMSKF